MNKKDEKWLNELIRKTVDSGKVEFDPEKWKQKYPEEFQLLKSRAAKSPARQANIWTAAFQSPIAKLAAAAVIIIAIGFLAVHQRPAEKTGTPKISKVTKSPAELMTLASLTFAYRRGGMEAVEEICDRAFKMVGPRPTRMSMQDLFEEFNGQNSERKKL